MMSKKKKKKVLRICMSLSFCGSKTISLLLSNLKNTWEKAAALLRAQFTNVDEEEDRCRYQVNQLLGLPQ